MKKLLLIIFILISGASFAQDEVIKAITDENYNFKIANGEVVWQFVYNTDKTPKEIIDYFTSANLFKIANIDSISITGNVERQSINYRKLGFKYMNVGMFLNSPANYNVQIEVKDNKYRVTIGNIVFMPAMSYSLYRVSANSNAQFALTEMCYNHKRNKFKSGFFDYNGAQPLAAFWYDMFLIKADPDTSDNW